LNKKYHSELVLNYSWKTDSFINWSTLATRIRQLAR
jgi:hypothetical protein